MAPKKLLPQLALAGAIKTGTLYLVNIYGLHKTIKILKDLLQNILMALNLETILH